MSLLMDALKKAELAKRQGQGEAAALAAENQQRGLSLEPLPAGTPPAAENAADKLPSLPSHLEDLDAQFLAEATQAASAARLKAQAAPAAALREPVVAAAQPDLAEAPVRAAPPTQARRPAPDAAAPRQAAAQNLFTAKQPAPPPARKSFAIVIGLVTVLAVCGIGGYFWWQLQPKTPAPMAYRAPPPAAPASTPVSKPAAVPPAPTLAATSAASATTAAATAKRAPETDDDEDAPATRKAAPQARRAAQPAETASAPSDSPVRVTRAPLKVNPALIRGFDAFNRGDLPQAQTEYERAHKSDPRNTDALHGLAAIALRQGRIDQADMLYRQIVEADPQDTVAHAALINMRSQADPGSAETRLKTLSAAQPELAAPHFSLGNLYARQGRWEEAQQAYFRAYSTEPDNPDILYNLAISLEHLRQNKLAAQYYGLAIAAAQSRPAGFDKAQAATRLNTLQP